MPHYEKRSARPDTGSSNTTSNRNSSSWRASFASARQSFTSSVPSSSAPLIRSQLDALNPTHRNRDSTSTHSSSARRPSIAQPQPQPPPLPHFPEEAEDDDRSRRRPPHISMSPDLPSHMHFPVPPGSGSQFASYAYPALASAATLPEHVPESPFWQSHQQEYFQTPRSDVTFQSYDPEKHPSSSSLSSLPTLPNPNNNNNNNNNNSDPLPNSKKSSPTQSVQLVNAVNDSDWTWAQDPNAPDSLDPSSPGQIEEDSPYPEVRSAVANADDMDMPAGTLRAWFIGVLWAVLIPGLNQFFYFRYPSISLGPLVAQLISFPLGLTLARLLPHASLLSLPLNPGPFTIKEHVLITIMAGVGAGSAYATDIIAVQRVYYGQTYPFSYQWFLVMSTQLIGFSIGGVARRFLVAPPSMIWPANLVYCTLFNTLHSQEYAGVGGRGGWSRQKFFFVALMAATIWYFLPGYLFTALSTFSWVCWIRPGDVKLNQLFGYNSGLGMSMVTFDWSQVAYIGSPLATPWWAEANIAVGFLAFFWVLTPLVYYGNVWDSQYMPILSRGAYDNTGQPYNVSRILTPESTLDLEAYKAYSPLFLSTTFAVSYGLSFASITATLTHALLYFRKQIVRQATRSLDEQPDIHARLMSRYRQVPDWWYATIFLIMFAFGVVSIEVWPTQMPVWAFVLALAISFVYVLPIGMIQAITNQQIGLNVVTELVIGYILPGRPIAMMLFKTWGFITMSQALQFVSDFKLGHYMKVPPRTMFFSQIVATVIAGTVQLAVQGWMFDNIPDMCSTRQKDGFVCPGTEVFFTASVIWGVIGPALQFSRGQMYYVLLFFFLAGAVAPVVPWVVTKKWPNSFMKYLNIPVLLGGTGYIPPANASNYVPWAIVGFIFQFLIRRRHFAWWTKYNYVLSAALDSSIAIGAVLIYFCLQWPRNGSIGEGSIGSWWGNTVYMNTADWEGMGIRSLGEGQTFGPKKW